MTAFKNHDQLLEQEHAEVDINERAAENYFRKYRPQMESLELSPLAKIRSLVPGDYAIVGKQLDQWNQWESFMHESGNSSELGMLPKIANDIITSSYGASVIPLLSSVQPIDEERGTVYFKQVRAEDTKGNMTANDVLTDPRSPRAYAEHYAHEGTPYVDVGDTVALTTNYTGTLTTDLRPNSVRIEIPLTTGTLSGLDDGKGGIAGIGLEGTIDYATGDWDINLREDPAETADILISYGVNYEESGNIPKIQSYIESTGVEAEIFALMSEVGLFKTWSMKKRFGIDAEDDMIADLTNEMVSEIGTQIIRELIKGSSTTQLWYEEPPDAISWASHIVTLKSAISQAERQILDQAGRGVVNQIIAGPNACARLSEVPGFQRSGIVLGGGPEMYGTLDGVNVIRATQINTNKIYCIYKGTTKFDTPVVYAPYMPLYVSKVDNHGIDNPVKRHAVAACWAGIKQVMGQFVTSITVTPGQAP